ncbi:MAG: VOC family protein [Synechococcales bacterium]|nr:VOC family protein [Synechococcales bacterium]
MRGCKQVLLSPVFLLPTSLLMSLEYQEIFVTLADPDGKSLIPFYQALFGIPPIVHIPEKYAEFQLARLRLSIFKPQSSQQSQFQTMRGGSFSLCFVVEDLETAIATLCKLGYPPQGELRMEHHGREIHAFDPLGNRLILYEKSGSYR